MRSLGAPGPWAAAVFGSVLPVDRRIGRGPEYARAGSKSVVTMNTVEQGETSDDRDR